MPDPILPKKDIKTHPAFKIFISIIIVVVLYTNVAIILGFTTPPVTLPTNNIAKHILNVFSVFSNYTEWNRDFIIKVLVQDQLSQKPNEWVRLDTYEHFPFKKGSQSSRFLLLMHSVKLDSSQYYLAHRFLAQKIKERYTRLHPGKKAVGIVLVIRIWPTSRKSYDDQKIPRLTKHFIIYKD